MFAVIGVWLGINFWATRDMGIVILVLPAILIVLYVDIRHAMQGEGKGITGPYSSIAYPIVVVGTMLVLFWILRLGGSWFVLNYPAAPLSLLLRDTFNIGRVFTAHDLSFIPTIKATEDYESLRHLEDYAAAGSNGGHGYLQIPLVRDVASTGLNDKLFAVLILAEHGYFAGFLFLCVLLGMLWFTLRLARRDFSTTTDRDWENECGLRRILAYAAAVTWAFTSIWMIGANVRSIPYIGKNITLLGLDSGMDAIYGLFLVALIFSVIRCDNNIRKIHKEAHHMGMWTLIILFGFGMYCIIAGFIHLGNDEERHDRVARAYPGFANSLFKSTPPILTAIDSLGRPYVVLNEIAGDVKNDLHSMIPLTKLRNDVERFNRRPEDYPIFQVDMDSPTRIKPAQFNQDYAIITNPLGHAYRFGGSARYRNELSCPVLAGLGKEWAAVPRPLEIVPPNRDEMKRIGRNVRAYTLGYNAILDFDAGPPPVLLNGRQINAHAGETRLDIGNIIEFTDNRGERRSMALYESGANGLFSRRWINGEERVHFGAGASFFMARPIYRALSTYGQQLIDGSESTKNLDSLEFELTIERELQEELQSKLETICRQQPRTFEPRQLKFLPASVCVMDCLTGEILALATYPTIDPNDNAAIEDQLGEEGSVPPSFRRRFKVNQNLVPHVLGSSVKPILSIASLTSHPELAHFQMPRGRSGNAAEEYTRLYNLELSDTLHADRHGDFQSMTFPEYMTVSDNLYNAMIHTIALLPAIPPSYTSAGGPSEQIFQIAPFEAHPHIKAPDFDSIYSGGDFQANLKHNLWSQVIGEAFDFRYESIATAESDHDTTMWNSLADVFRPSQVASDDILPEVDNLRLEEVRDIRKGWISILLGGKFRLNNIQTATAYSRIITGRRITPSLVTTVFAPSAVSSDFDTLFAYDPQMKRRFADARALVLEGCQRVIWDKDGTGRSQGELLNRLGFDKDKYFALGKTGTLRRIADSELRSTAYRAIRKFWSPRKRVPNSNVWVGVYGEGSPDSAKRMICVVVYTEDRQEEKAPNFALNVANAMLPDILTTLGFIGRRSH